jgi:hypothetical protein
MLLVKHIFLGPIAVAKMEASSNVLVAGCANGADTSTIVQGRRDFVLKVSKHYCSS